MKKWPFLLGTAAVAAALGVVVILSRQAACPPGDREEIPEIIADCFERIRQIEAELDRLHPEPEVVS